MTIPVRLLLSLLACVFSVAGIAQPLPMASPASVGMSLERLERIGNVLNADIERNQIPGAVVAIARKGSLVYYEAFGFLDKPQGIPMPRDAIFYIASMTKPVTTVGALTLVEEARLLVDDPVDNYLPQLSNLSVIRGGSSATDVTDTESARRQPTLQDLMRHTAGFTYGNRDGDPLAELYPQGSRAAADTLTGPEFVETLASLPLHYQPGTTWQYGFGLDVLGLVIEAVTDQSLGQFLDARLFRPLGMVDTAFVISPEKLDRYAKVLPKDPLTGNDQRIPDFSQPRKFDAGGCCLVSTASDYLRFAQMLLNGGMLEGTRILGPKTVEFMTADQLGPEVNIDRLRALLGRNGYGFGLGVAVRRSTGVSGFIGSAGDYDWGGANGTYFWVDPREELAVVLMAATPGAMRLHYRQVIRSLVLQAIID